MKEGITNVYAPMILGWAVTYSSTNPDLPNTGEGQDFLSDEYRDTILGWYRGTEDDLSEDEIEAALMELPVDGFEDLINPDIHEMIMSAHENDNVKDVCELAEEGKTDKFCEAVALNDIKKDLAEVDHVTRLCWASSDEEFLFRANVPPWYVRIMNFNLRTIIIPGIFLDPGESGVALDHQTAGGYCLVLDALFFHLL